MEERVKISHERGAPSSHSTRSQDYVRSRVKRQSLCVIWEDMHWADPSSLEVFESLLPISTEARLLLVCVARPDENLATELLGRVRDKYSERYQSIELSP